MKIAWDDWSTETRDAWMGRMLATGLTHREIAERYEIQPQVVAQFATRLKKRGVVFPAGINLGVPVRKSVWSTLRRVADQRGVPVELLCADLLTVIATDGMVDSVLDDLEVA